MPRARKPKLPKRRDPEKVYYDDVLRVTGWNGLQLTHALSDGFFPMPHVINGVRAWWRDDFIRFLFTGRHVHWLRRYRK